MYDVEHGVQKKVLQNKYHFEGDELTTMVEDVAMASGLIDMERMTRETESREHLGIGIYEKEDENPNLRAYKTFAGQPAAIGRAVLLFSELGSQFFASGNLPQVNKVGMDLGGTRQALSWGGTGELDAMAEDLKEQLRNVFGDDVEEFMHIFGRSKAMNKNHIVRPVHPIRDGQYNPNFVSLLDRRRRGAANIKFPNRPEEIHIIKQSQFILVRNRLSEREQELISTEYATFEKYQHNIQKEVRKRTATAGIGARAVEEAIRSKDQNPQAVIPMGAHYIAVMHRAK